MSIAQYPSAPAAPQPPKPQKFAGLAWTALILGIVGVVGSPIIFLNNLTAVAAVVGLILGIIALFGTKKILAGIGTGLCVAGFAFTVMAQQAMTEDIFGTTNSGSVSDAAEAQPAAGAQLDEAAEQNPTWGKRYTWDSGLAAEVSAPVDCTPSEWAMPSNVERAAKVTVTVINGTGQPFDASMLAFGSEAQFEGRTAEAMFDSEGDCGAGAPMSATVMPGKTFTYESAYAVGRQPGELQLVLQPSFGEDRAVFVGRG